METITTSVVLIERLAPEDYDELKSVEEGYRPDPKHSIVVVARENGLIVGRTMLIRPFHVEGTWVAEHKRKGLIGIRLLQRLEKEARNQGVGTIYAYAMESKIEEYLMRMGYKQSRLTIWEKPV
jgi:N-acetylglutamate synthase-like GNAT family acetyltransferase